MEESITNLAQARIKLEEMTNDNINLEKDLDRQKQLYHELKKMRGRGEELEAIRDYQQVKMVTKQANTEAGRKT